MGVIIRAHARFFDSEGNPVTVPAPVDPATPDAPWWFDHVAESAKGWAEAGFTAIMFPPVCKTQSGDKPTGDGYGVFDQYDIGWKNQMYSIPTRFGDREQLQRAIAVVHANGLDVYVDCVLHQVIGGNNGVYEYVGADGKTKNGRFPKQPGCFRGAPPRRPEDAVPVPADDFSFGDEFVYQNCDPPGYTIDQMIAWGDWLTRSLDIQGYRFDDTKGTWAPFVHQWMTSKSMASRFVVSEYFDGNPDSLNWWRWSQVQGRSLVYDFTLHWALQAMCDSQADMRQMNGAGYTARDPYGTVTFVDNLDTDTSPGQQIIGSKLLAYAFILTTEGYPSVYVKDYETGPGCYGLKQWIDNLVWIHEHLAIGSTKTLFNDQTAIVLERSGPPGLISAISNDPINHRTITCQSGFPEGWLLHDYTGHHADIWVQAGGMVTFTIPSNYFGNGQSYLCFAPAGLGKANEPGSRKTSQEFFLADDLDIPSIMDGRQITLPRLFLAAGSEITLALEVHADFFASGVAVEVVVEEANGKEIGSGVWTPTSRGNFTFKVATSGYHLILLASSGVRAPQHVVLKATYLAPSTLS